MSPFPSSAWPKGVGCKPRSDRFAYGEAITFGHALEEPALVFTQGFNDPAQVARYGAFMDAVAELVAARFGGSSSAEHAPAAHGPYVELEWGLEGMALMRRISGAAGP